MREGIGVAMVAASDWEGTGGGGKSVRIAGAPRRAAAAGGGGGGLAGAAPGKRDCTGCGAASGVADGNDTSLGIFRSTILRMGRGGAPEPDVDIC